MVLFIGEKYKDFIQSIGDISTEGTAEMADKLIVTCDCEKAAEAIKTAKARKIPVLALVDGYKAAADAFGAKLCDVSATCPTGEQEWAVIDATSPVYLELESVIKVARANPYAVDEKTLPAELDCMSRAETGEIVAMRNWEEPKKYGNIYVINYDLSSDKTPDGVQIVKNFFNM